jgi:CubicO group peptidase (beta-lactamase class C family)
MMRRFFASACFAALALALGACAGPTLPKPDANGSYLFWTPEEQLVGYRNLEKIYPASVIERGAHVAPMPRAAEELNAAFTHDGAAMTTESFMENGMAAGVLVIHRGEIVLERYAHGYGPGQRWTSFSVAKMISSTLAGAALKDGAIRSLDDMVTAYLPGLKGSAYEGVTVRHLLTMTSGVKWDETYSDPNSDVGRIRSSRTSDGSDPIVAYMAKLPREAEPGTKWVYKTGETHLVGSVVRAATGKKLTDYLSEKIWTPYGMEKDAIWMLDSAGGEFAGCCISATLRDFGRFAMFFMDGAKVNGESIVPEGWVDEATTPTPVSIRGAGGYGYQWWTGADETYRALGIFGQLIQFVPEDDLIVVVQSAWPSSGDPPSGALQGAFVAAVQDAVAAQRP